jgi:hypothetical protein|tara:strand:+ start:21826 stop:22179 length:354 start_codon:yes stop_codon:yes gene_type:complete
MFTLEELYQMRNYSVMDFIYKIDEIMDKLEPRAGRAMKKEIIGSKDTRRYLGQIKFICDVTRSKVQVDLGKKRKRELIELEIEKELRKINNVKTKYAKKIESLKKARHAQERQKRGN